MRRTGRRPGRLRQMRAEANRERGATAVEFAIVCPLVFFMLTWMIYGGLLVTYNALAQHTVRQTVHEMVLSENGSDVNGSYYAAGDVTDVATLANQQSPGFLPKVNAADINFGYDNCIAADGCVPGPGSEVKVTISYSTPVLSALRPLLFGIAPDVTVTVSATGRLE